MEKQIEDLNKKKGSGVENQSTFSNQNAQRLAIQNSRAYLLDCQAFEEALRKNALPNTGEHPYNQLQDMLGDVLVMLNTATRQESKPRCVETVKTAANYIKRIYRIHRSLFKSGAADPQYPRTPVQLIRIKGCIRYILKKAGERLTLNKSLTEFLTLYGIKQVIEEPTELIAEAYQHVVNFIAGDIKGGSSK